MAETYINAGDLRRRIQIIRREDTEDRDGYATTKTVVVHSCWAQVVLLSGTEMTRENADFGELRGRFTIRRTRKPIDRKMAVRYGGKEFEIQYINPDDAPGRYLTIWGVWKSKEAGGNGKPE